MTTEQSESAGSVQAIFNRISDRYDFLNHFLSGGLDFSWRKKMVSKMRFFNTNLYLDIATGTGDVALSCIEQHPEANVVAADFAQAMLAEAKIKVNAAGRNDRIRLQCADATHLPFADNVFDIAGMAFGIRNIPDKTRALSEMVRVINPGGQVMVLELTTPENRSSKALYALYLRKALPFLAGIFTAKKEAYQYLGRSIIDFPKKSEFLAMMSESGIKNPSAIPFSFGICHLYMGVKP